MVLRVAHFIQRYPPALGGSEAYLPRLSRFLVQEGDRVTVFTTDADALEAFWLPGRRNLPSGTSVIDDVEVRRFALNLRFRGRRWLLKPLALLPHRSWQSLTVPCNPLSWAMWRESNQTGVAFDVVHASAFPYAFPILCARRLARRLGVPFFLTPFLHLGDPLNPRDRTRRVYTSPALMALARSADLVFAQTPSERACLVQHGVRPDTIVLQGLGVDADDCTGGERRQVRQAWNVAPDEVVIGHLANNSEEKGTADLLRPAEMLWRRGAKFHVVLAGPQMPNFLRFWQNYPYAGRVRCLGPLTDSQKRDFFAAIDLFALPSRSDSFGLVLLEASANGLPNVAYRAGGVADLVRHERDGLLAACGCIAELAQQLADLIGDEELRLRLGEAGKSRLDDFRWPDKLACVRAAYLRHQRLLGQPV